MISWGNYERNPPFQKALYCGICRTWRTFFLDSAHTTIDKDCYECSHCHHLIFAPVPTTTASDGKVVYISEHPGVG